MPPDARRYLADMMESTSSIEQFVAGKVRDDLTNDKLLRPAV
jgi:uncharacterized protein with HEPN domain